MWWRNVTLIFGIVFLAVGIAGFIDGLVTPPAPPTADGVVVDGAHGRLFGLFPVNGLHNLVHIAFGLWGFFAYFSGRLPSRTYLRSVAVVYAVFMVMGFIPGLDTTFGLVPLYGHDIWLHALLALVAGVVGFGVTEHEADTTATTGERRRI